MKHRALIIALAAFPLALAAFPTIVSADWSGNANGYYSSFVQNFYGSIYGDAQNYGNAVPNNYDPEGGWSASGDYFPNYFFSGNFNGQNLGQQTANRVCVIATGNSSAYASSYDGSSYDGFANNSLVWDGSQWHLIVTSHHYYAAPFNGEESSGYYIGNIYCVSPAGPQNTLTADTSSVGPGGSADITWNDPGNDACSSSGFDITSAPPNCFWACDSTDSDGNCNWTWDCVDSPPETNGTFNTGPLYGTTNYSYTCSNNYGSHEADATINVIAPPPAPSASISASPSSITQGDSSTLSWSCGAADSAYISNYGGVNSDGGSAGVSPSSTTTYGLTCYGPGGQATDYASVNVSYQSCTSAANSCGATNSGNIVNGSCSASTPANPAGYGNSCTSGANSCGQTNSGTYQCNGSCSASTPSNSSCTPSCTLSSNPSSIVLGQTATLTWSCSNVTSCNALGGFSTGGAPNNSTGVTVTPSLTSNYQISCSGPGGSTNSNISTVTVLQPTVSISANPVRVATTGGSSIITWSSADVSSCAVSGPGLSSSALSGNHSVSITTQSIYTITCQSTSGPVTQSVTVNLTPGFNEF